MRDVQAMYYILRSWLGARSLVLCRVSAQPRVPHMLRSSRPGNIDVHAEGVILIAPAIAFLLEVDRGRGSAMASRLAGLRLGGSAIGPWYELVHW
jgi:hypothetical protein